MAGIVRRIDTLGRIVIPKEIRKSLKIKNGDFMDIAMENNEVVLKKNSNFLDIDSFLDSLVNKFGDNLSKDIIIFDNNRVICQYSKLIPDCLDSEIADDLIETIKNRKKNIFEYEGELTFLNSKVKGHFLIGLVIPNGDMMGGVLIYAAEPLRDKDEVILTSLTDALTNYVEE